MTQTSGIPGRFGPTEARLDSRRKNSHRDAVRDDYLAFYDAGIMPWHSASAACASRRTNDTRASPRELARFRPCGSGECRDQPRRKRNAIPAV